MSSVSSFVLPTSPVEVVSKSNDVNSLKRFITSPDEYVDTSIPYMEPALIDLQRLLDSEDELQKFESLLNSWGAFQLVNHGIDSSILDQVLQVTKEFFRFPIEEKQKYGRSTNQTEGWKYDKMEGWGNDKMTENQAFNWNDRIMLGIYPLKIRNSKFWPDEILPKFREVVEAYAAGLARIKEILFKAVSKMLKLPEDNLISKYANEGIMISRFNYFPPCPHPDRILGARPHTDSNMFTILLQDKDVEGLHFQKDDQWYIVPIIHDALVVNTSDMLEILTNGRVKSVTHRAVTNSERERISVAFAIGPPPNSEIGPLKELIDEQRPQLYPYLRNSSDTTADFFARGKIFIKEARKLGPAVLGQ